MSRAYYNEIDPFCVQWLRNLIDAGHLPAGDVDDRPIQEVEPGDLKGYAECHFFAGIGGWPYALQLVGWDGPVWTGSCPCQPFSGAGKAHAVGDERHLWPAFHRLITECRPPVVFGEQVASKLGRHWLAGVRVDLEELGYAVGAADLCAASLGAPHIRQRLWWVAESEGRRHGQHQRDAGAVGDPTARGEGEESETRGLAQAARHRGEDGRVADAERRATERHGQPVGRTPSSDQGREEERERLRTDAWHGRDPWSNAVWLPCRDGKARRIEPGLEPLAHGIPGRVGRLRGYGNAIIPQVAAAFVTAYMEAA